MNVDEFFSKWKRKGVWHFTDRKNCCSIKRHGILSLKTLEEREVDVCQYASSEDSRGIDRNYKLDNYVRLCFVNQHPMEYRAREDGRLKSTKWLRISTEILKTEGVRISDGIAYAEDATIYDDFEKAAEDLDWKVLFTKTDWNDSAIQERLQRARKYEILVPNEVPLDMILTRITTRKKNG